MSNEPTERRRKQKRDYMRRWIKNLTPIERKAYRKRQYQLRWAGLSLEEKRAAWCKERSEYRKRHLDKERKRGRDKERRRRGVVFSPHDELRLLDEQNGCCAICFTPKPGGKGGFHLDHCHETGRIRGLLCHKCNTGLGLFQDSLVRLLGAFRYLVKYEKI